MDLNQYLPANNIPTFDAFVELRRIKKLSRENLTRVEQVVGGVRCIERLACGDITKGKIAMLLQTSYQSLVAWIRKAELHFHENHGLNIHEHIQNNTRAKYNAYVNGNSNNTSNTVTTNEISNGALESLNQNLSRILDKLTTIETKVAEHDNFISSFRNMFGGMMNTQSSHVSP